MRFYEIIKNKRNGGELSTEEIKFWIQSYSKGKIPDEQVSALLMAIYYKGMSPEETHALTKEMIASGDTVQMTGFKGYTIDKHSTGGVGDKTSLTLGPLLSSLGLAVGKMSGRGLGHTGGTLDKLESIPGFSCNLKPAQLKRQIKNINLAIIGQTKSLAPADGKLYALRDVTATVDSIPLIAASIMSKKLAIKNKGLILDVKVGSGAFMKSLKDAKKLARVMVDIGKLDGRDCMAIISTMEQPLGSAVGNSLEVIEAIKTLTGEGPDDYTALVYEIAVQALKLSKIETNKTRAMKLIKEAISSGQALEKLAKMVECQGGDPKYIYKPEKLKVAKKVDYFTAPSKGYIKTMQTENIGLAAMALGAGRERKEDKVDLSVGFRFLKKIGDPVKKGEEIVEIYHNRKGLKSAKAILQESIIFAKSKVNKPQIILAKV